MSVHYAPAPGEHTACEPEDVILTEGESRTSDLGKVTCPPCIDDLAARGEWPFTPKETEDRLSMLRVCEICGERECVVDQLLNEASVAYGIPRRYLGT